MNDLKDNIAFRLFSLKTDEFATFDLGSDGVVPELTVDLTFSSDLDNHLVACIMGFKFAEESKILAGLKVTCLFDIEKNSWEKSVVKDDKYIVPKHILDHFCVITIGASRGIYHAKTENTPFNRFMIPTMDITKLISSDVEFIRK